MFTKLLQAFEDLEPPLRNKLSELSTQQELLKQQKSSHTLKRTAPAEEAPVQRSKRRRMKPNAYDPGVDGRNDKQRIRNYKG
jgi:hypothetical protein